MNLQAETQVIIDSSSSARGAYVPRLTGIQACNWSLLITCIPRFFTFREQLSHFCLWFSSYLTHTFVIHCSPLTLTSVTRVFLANGQRPFYIRGSSEYNFSWSILFGYFSNFTSLTSLFQISSSSSPAHPSSPISSASSSATLLLLLHSAKHMKDRRRDKEKETERRRPRAGP